jgi:hypothetical protein
VDDDGAPIAGARVWTRVTLETYSAVTGDFELAVPSEGDYLVSAEHEGYFLLKDHSVHVGTTPAEVTLVLNPQREVFQSVSVGESPSPVDPEQTTYEQHLTGTEINDIPYPSSHSLLNSFKLMPGVIQDASGGVHFHGGAEYQTQYTLDGFDITDPITGRFTTLLAVEGVRTLDLVSGREPPQYGRGSAGSLGVVPDSGTDGFHYTATNFVPGLDSHGGGFHVGHSTPRAGISGPIVKGRAWFSDSFNGEYNDGYVSGLPKGQDTNQSWSAGNLLHVQVNLTSANILYGDFLSDFQHAAHVGLGALDPIETTTKQRSSEWLTAVKDSYAWGRGWMVEAGFAWQAVFYRAVPQGDAPYLITPEGRSGNYFVNSQQHGRRDQVFVNLFPRPFHFLGKHQVQAGTDTQRLDYRGVFARSSYEIVGLSGFPLFNTTFLGSGTFDRPGLTVATYINDRWQPVTGLMIDVGVRQDWDELVRQSVVEPRVGIAYAPFGNVHTKLTAGYAVILDATNLALFSRPLDQQAITVPYTPQGVPEPGTLTTFVAGGPLKMPRYVNWSASIEHDFGHRLAAKVDWLRKRGRDGFVYAPQSASPVVDLQPQALGYGYGSSYILSNERRDAYDEVAISARQSFSGQYEWFASYVRSRAVSNAVLDVSVDQPIQVLNNTGRMPWDAPNRFLGWGYLPVPFLSKNWAFAYLLDYRTGFPFSVTTDGGVVVGPVDSHRYPTTFDLNLSIERIFTFRGRRFALRAGCNNVTDHVNPTAVNNVIGAPEYLQFFGSEGRHFEFRVRFFGKKGS